MSEDASSGKGYFLSYSRTDEAFALRFARDLRAVGIAIWVDQLDIRPSEHWDRAIECAVRACRGLIVILSPRSAASDNVADEISFAIDNGKSVLPVMIERCSVPLRITRMQMIDATGNYERALKQSIEVLGGTGPIASPADAAVPVGIDDPEILAAARARLTPIVGPIAALLVDKAAARARSVGELYDLLATHASSDEERRQLAMPQTQSAAPPAARPRQAELVEPTQALVSQSEVERLAGILLRHLGPIAHVIARREAAQASSSADLQQRLAGAIPQESERSEFLRRAAAIPGTKAVRP